MIVCNKIQQQRITVAAGDLTLTMGMNKFIALKMRSLKCSIELDMKQWVKSVLCNRKPSGAKEASVG